MNSEKNGTKKGMYGGGGAKNPFSRTYRLYFWQARAKLPKKRRRVINVDIPVAGRGKGKYQYTLFQSYIAYFSGEAYFPLIPFFC